LRRDLNNGASCVTHGTRIRRKDRGGTWVGGPKVTAPEVRPQDFPRVTNPVCSSPDELLSRETPYLLTCGALSGATGVRRRGHRHGALQVCPCHDRVV